jgi:hypothetical protein
MLPVKVLCHTDSKPKLIVLKNEKHRNISTCSWKLFCSFKLAVFLLRLTIPFHYFIVLHWTCRKSHIVKLQSRELSPRHSFLWEFNVIPSLKARIPVKIAILGIHFLKYLCPHRKKIFWISKRTPKAESGIAYELKDKNIFIRDCAKYRHILGFEGYKMLFIMPCRCRCRTDTCYIIFLGRLETSCRTHRRRKIE